jgi:hypothetical protein
MPQNRRGTRLYLRDSGMFSRVVLKFAMILPMIGGGWAQSSPGTSYLTSFGAKCDGNSNDTAAIANWLASAVTHHQLIAPPGVCIFRSALATPAGGLSQVAVTGAGPYQTTFLYDGSSTTINLLTIGDGTHPYVNWLLQGFRIASTTKMTAGTGLYLEEFWRSSLLGVVIDGQDGTGNLWNGIWFHGTDFVTWDAGQVSAQNDGVRVDGTPATGQADLFLSHLKVAPSNGSRMAVGIHVGGGFGGFACDSASVIGSATNVLVDNALVTQPNREVNLATNCFVDSAINTNVLVNDALANGSNLFFGGWNASAKRYGYFIESFKNGNISFSGNTIYNNGTDGVYFGDTSVNASFSSNVQVYKNGTSGTGYGINAGAPITLRSPLPTMYNNTSGGTNGVMPNVLVRQLGTGVSPTGAANAPLVARITFPIGFPNAVVPSTCTATLDGSSNQAPTRTIDMKEISNVGANVAIVSSVTETIGIPFSWHCSGY